MDPQMGPLFVGVIVLWDTTCYALLGRFPNPSYRHTVTQALILNEMTFGVSNLVAFL